MRLQQRWQVVAEKINFICDIQAGKLFPLGQKKHSYVNDRFFLYNTGGYINIGHTEPSLRPSTEVPEKAEQANLVDGLHKVVMGDDMGCEQYAYLGGRLDFLNIPFIRQAGVKLFSQAELIYYPPQKKSTLNAIDDIRVTLGFGISMPLNEMINFGLFYNAANFGSKVGDIERSSLINFQFNFF